MKTKKPIVNLANQNHYPITAKNPRFLKDQGGHYPFHLQDPLSRRLSEGHMLLICIQDVKRLFVLKTPIF